jgi:hypothetical protein
MPPETNPRLVFERLFGDLDTSIPAETRARRLQHRRSILDLVSEGTRRLVADLGAPDRRKLDEYLESIREIERRIERSEADLTGLTPSIDKPTGIPPQYSDYVNLMFDLQIVAFQTDSTRVVTMMMGREGSLRTYPEIGVPDPHHPLTHHRGNPEWIERVTKINSLHAELFAGFLRKLQSTPDGEGTLLDHSMVVYGSGLSDGNRHTHEDLPVLLAGRGGGFRLGRHVVYPTNTPMTNLYLTLLDRIGVLEDKIGDSTGRIEHLTDMYGRTATPGPRDPARRSQQPFVHHDIGAHLRDGSVDELPVRRPRDLPRCAAISRTSATGRPVRAAANARARWSASVSPPTSSSTSARAPVPPPAGAGISSIW